MPQAVSLGGVGVRHASVRTHEHLPNVRLPLETPMVSASQVEERYNGQHGMSPRKQPRCLAQGGAA